MSRTDRSKTFSIRPISLKYGFAPIIKMGVKTKVLCFIILFSVDSVI